MQHFSIETQRQMNMIFKRDEKKLKCKKLGLKAQSPSNAQKIFHFK